MNWTALFIIIVVLGVIVSNIMLLKYSAKMSLKNVNQDPIEKAKEALKERDKDEDKPIS
ncbi:DUF2897 family protein [Psychrosphaera sp.]|nr:DUF2897 family protein [Psychrosphaera sp.]